ncbi:MAG: xanthine dehydrogenase small subunit [Azospirillaceae bacterium]
MSDRIHFLLGETATTAAVEDPTTTVLQWLRARGRTGTKEGCAEGDCGACTVVLGELDGSADAPRLRYRAVNSCIQFLPTLHGRQLLTVEDLAEPGGDLHPTQDAMVAEHGSQCGFCTPGFVMALFALYHDPDLPESPDRAAIDDGLAGNLCRCTGYRPIVAAARRALGGERADRFSRGRERTMEALQAIRAGRMPEIDGFHAPRSVTELVRLYAERPKALLLGGGTDVGLWVTKDHRRLPALIHVGDVADMRDVVDTGDTLDIGAAATYTEILPALDRRFPDFAAMVRRLGAMQVRNAGTMGGNVANGSPIGDSMPPLIALGARVVLNRAGQRREMALEDFYLGYKRTALEEGEFVERLRIPIWAEDRRFGVYKVSKRRDQDISAVCAGFAFSLTEDGRVTAFRAAYGGMAATPKRARAAEAAVEGRPWTLETVAAGMAALARDFEPMTDMRASAEYRASTARNLMMKLYLETTGQIGGPKETRVARHG